MNGRLFGVDFSTSGLKIAQLRVSAKEMLIEHLLKLPPDVSPSEALAAAGIAPKGATVGLAGADVMVRYLRIQQVPPPRLKMIMEFELGEMKSKSTEPLCADYILDTVPDTTGEVTSMVVLVKESVAASRIAEAERMRISSYSLLPNSFALYNTFLALKAYDPEKAYLLLDIGAESTSLALVSGLRLLAARSLSIGGNLFTQFLADSLGVSFQEAERIKTTEGVLKKSGWVSERQKRISDALAQAAERFAGTVSSSLMFLKRQLRKRELSFDKILLFGGGALLEGLAEHLGSVMRMDTEVANVVSPPEDRFADVDKRPPLRQLLPASELQSISPSASEFATAIGLALSRIEEPFVSLDLIPEKVRKRILFRERTVYLIVAGVLLLVFAILLGIGVRIERGSSLAKEKALGERYSEAQTELAEMEKIRKEIMLQKEALGHLRHLPEVNRSIVLLFTDLMRKDITPDEVTLTSISYRHRGRERGEERKSPPSVRLSGEVVGEWGTEIDAVRNFRKALASLDYVESASIDAARTKIDPSRGRYLFSIVVQLKEK